MRPAERPAAQAVRAGVRVRMREWARARILVCACCEPSWKLPNHRSSA